MALVFAGVCWEARGMSHRRRCRRRSTPHKTRAARRAVDRTSLSDRSAQIERTSRTEKSQMARFTLEAPEFTLSKRLRRGSWPAATIAFCPLKIYHGRQCGHNAYTNRGQSTDTPSILNRRRKLVHHQALQRKSCSPSPTYRS